MPDPLKRPNPIFFGGEGLRAGWSIALFLSPFLMLLGAGWLVIHLDPDSSHPKERIASQLIIPATVIFGEALSFVFLAAAAFGMSLIEHRPFSGYGLTSKRLLPDFAAGIAWGAILLSLLIAALRLAHAIAFDGLALHGAAAFAYSAKWAIAFLFVGLLEEFLFRGYLQFTLARGVAGIVRAISPANRNSHTVGFWVAAFLLSGCIFAGTHISNHGETLTGILAVACAGGVFAFSLYRTGSLWWAIGFHSAWDWSESFLYGTPDSGNTIQGYLLLTHPVGAKLLSGGSDGPEGSILVIPTLLLAALIIHLTLPRRTSPEALPQKTLPHLQSIA